MQASRRDLLSILHLRPQERGDDVARQKRRADVHPGVFVDTSLKKRGAVGPLLSQNGGAIDKGRVVDEQGTAFAGDQVLRLVKAQRPDVTNRAQCLVLKLRKMRLRRV